MWPGWLGTRSKGGSWSEATVDISPKLWVSWRTGTHTFLIIQLRVPPGLLVSWVLVSYYKVMLSPLKKILFLAPLRNLRYFKEFKFIISPRPS